MEFNIEKLISDGKALLGYDQTDVQEEFESFQKSYSEKKKRLLQEIESAKAENLMLKEKLKEISQSTVPNNYIDEISSKFMNVFLEDIQSVSKLKSDLERLEKPYYETLHARRKQKDVAKRGINEATEFLKSLQEDFSSMQESDGYLNER